MKNRPIGIFDSGVGGLTVVKAMLKRLPHESFVYYGDTLHVPYGTKSREELFKYAYDIVGFLLSREVKTIVVACGTHSSVTLPEMEQEYGLPMLGVVKPGARAAVQTTQTGKIGIIATQASVDSGSYTKNIKAIAPGYETFSAACTRFVPLVEAGQLTGEDTVLAVREYVRPLLEAGIDTLIMGCTHYPFLAPVISEFAGENVALVDPAAETVEELAEILFHRKLLNESDGMGKREFYVSGSPDSFYKVGRMLIGDVIENVEKIVLD